MARIVKKAPERRKEIIKAAREHFQTEDFKKMTMQDLMTKLNIAKGTIYHHFASKGEILEAVIEDMVDEELVRKQDLLKKHQRLKPLEKMTLLITESSMDRDNEKLLENLHHPENSLIHTRQLARFLLKLAPLYASVIAEGCEDGTFKAKNPLECAEFLIAGVQFLTDIGFYPWDEDQLQRRMAAFPFLVETLLGAPAGSFNFLNNG
ncbi:TetR/AcrR family transcriptional regulator [Desulfoluna sp.]|uniref:TetR/AcrR family transcriptional regulator n=1 Tax=Desulfoluna sp. TaxID=2045199 RepID=UPI00260C1305|nr:TetR/AcrR family transcriptional regulator [Desulfoluna sp.]